MYLDFGIKNSTLGQWEAVIPGIATGIKSIFGGGKTQAQKQAESEQRRVGRAKSIVDSLPTLNRFPQLKSQLYSYLANCMPVGCPCEPLAAYIASSFPREVGEEIMGLSPSIMGTARAGEFITNWQGCMRPKLATMKMSSQIPPPVSEVTVTNGPPIITTEIAPWPTRDFPWTTPPIAPIPQAPTIVTATGAPSPVMQAGLGIDPQTLLIGGGVALGAILLSQGRKRRR